MNLDAYKELIPVVYGEAAAKFLLDFYKEPGQECFRLHWHERMELLRIWDGSIELQLGDEKLTAVAGELVLIYPKQPHHALSGERGVVYDVIMFDIDHLRNETLASSKYLEPMACTDVIFASKTDDPQILAISDQVLRQYRNRENGNPLRLIAGFYDLLGTLYERLPQKRKPVDRTADNFRPVVEYVDANFTQEMSTASLSRKFGYNEAYFCRKFKKTTGLNAMKYIQILRLEHAKKLLERGDEPVSMVAARCGYPDVCHFTHCFSRHFGMSPSALRKKAGK